MSGWRRQGLWFGVGAVLGAVAGFAWWTREQQVHQRALFSPRPMRRLAALGWLSGQPGAEAVMVLREYLAWEQNPLLRRRARRLLQRYEHAL